jgi:hypothetical protein
VKEEGDRAKNDGREALAVKTEATFLPVTTTDAPEQSAETSQLLPMPALVIVERSAPGIEVELIGGPRFRDARREG